MEYLASNYENKLNSLTDVHNYVNDYRKAKSEIFRENIIAEKYLELLSYTVNDKIIEQSKIERNQYLKNKLAEIKKNIHHIDPQITDNIINTLTTPQKIDSLKNTLNQKNYLNQAILKIEEISPSLARIIKTGIDNYAEKSLSMLDLITSAANLLNIAKHGNNSQHKKQLNWLLSTGFKNSIALHDINNIISALKSNELDKSLVNLTSLISLFSKEGNHQLSRSIYYGSRALLHCANHAQSNNKNKINKLSTIMSHPHQILRDWTKVLQNKQPLSQKLSIIFKNSFLNHENTHNEFLGGVSYLAGFASHLIGNKKLSHLFTNIIAPNLTVLKVFTGKKPEYNNNQKYATMATILFQLSNLADIGKHHNLYRMLNSLSNSILELDKSKET